MKKTYKQKSFTEQVYQKYLTDLTKLPENSKMPDGSSTQKEIKRVEKHLKKLQQIH